jgi:hypothetical protein
VNAPEIVKVVAERMRETSDGTELPQDGDGSPGLVRNELIATVRTAVHAIEVRSPSEVEAFKVWLASIAAKACQASKPDIREKQSEQDRQDAFERLAEILAHP